MSISRRNLALVGAGALSGAVLGLGSVTLAQAGEEAALAKAVEGLRKAMLAADKAQFEALCAEDLSYGHSAGRIETKAEFIAASTNGKSTWKSIAFSEQTVKVTGNSGIARFLLTGDNESEGKVNAIKIGVLTVWQKQGNDWKLLARQAFRL